MGWAEMYDNCTFEAKKMIVAQFVKAVHVRRDYEIDIEFNVSFEEFQALYLEGEPEEAKRPGADTLLTIETKTRQAIISLVLFMVDSKGFEPSTSRMRTERSPNRFTYMHHNSCRSKYEFVAENRPL